MARYQIAGRLTGYWPYQAGLSASERLMEGGHSDAASKPLYTLEMFQRGEAPYVSVSGDNAAWPYGQLIEIDAWPDVVFRIVDTGGHFKGPGKVYRTPGREPFDICVDSSSTKVPPQATVTIIEGDAWPEMKKSFAQSINWSAVKGQTPSDDGEGGGIENAVKEVIAAVEEVIDGEDPTALVALALVTGAVLYFALT